MLRSRNPYDKPLLYAGYFTHPEDIKVGLFYVDLLHLKHKLIDIHENINLF